MPAKKQPTLRERLERVWQTHKPDAEKGTEHSAEDAEVRTPAAGEFFANLERAAEKDDG